MSSQDCFKVIDKVFQKADKPIGGREIMSIMGISMRECGMVGGEEAVPLRPGYYRDQDFNAYYKLMSKLRMLAVKTQKARGMKAEFLICEYTAKGMM